MKHYNWHNDARYYNHYLRKVYSSEANSDPEIFICSPNMGANQWLMLSETLDVDDTYSFTKLHVVIDKYTGYSN